MDQLPVSKPFSAILIRDGENGADGAPAVVYQLSLAGSRFRVEGQDIGVSKMSVNIHGSVLKIVGGQAQPYNLSAEELTLRIDCFTGEPDYVPANRINISGNTFSTTYNNGVEWYEEEVFVAILTVGGIQVASDQVQIEVVDPAVSYQLSLAGSVFWVEGTVPEESTMHVGIQGNVLKSVGGSIQPYNLSASELTLRFDKASGSPAIIPANRITISGNTFSTTYYDETPWDEEEVLVAVLTINNVVVATNSIQIMKQGDRGADSKSCYIAGDYRDDVEYISNSRQTVAVTWPVNGSEDEVWVLEAATNVVNNVHIAPHDSGQRVWSRGLNNYNLVKTKYLFADFANLGSFVVVGKYFISQYGTLYQYINNEVRKYNEGSSRLYQYFDTDDPMVEVMPDEDTPLKWRPVLCIDAERGEAWLAGGRIRMLQKGDIEMNNAVIKGSLMYHKVMMSSTDTQEEGQKLFSMYNSSGSEIPISDTTSVVDRMTLDCDTFILTGSKRDYTIFLPPASFFPGASIKIINGTYSGGSGTTKQDDPSRISLAVVYRSDTEELDDDNYGYAKNNMTAGVVYNFSYYGGDVALIGAPDSSKLTDFGDDAYGFPMSATSLYKSIELISTLNSEAGDGTSYAWMIVEARL